MGTVIANFRGLAGLYLGVLLLCACSSPRDPVSFSGPEVTRAPQGVTAYFDRDVQQVFNRSCVAGCHEPGGSGQVQSGLVLTPEAAYVELLNPTASKNGPHVIPGNADESALIWKLEGKDAGGRPVFGDRMPLGRPALSGQEIQAIWTWIEEGALRSAAPPAPPSLVSAASVDSATVELVFSEALDGASAERVENYAVTAEDSLAVLSAVLAGPDRVVLTTALQAPGASYTVVVRNVQDLSGAAIRPGEGDAGMFRFTPGVSFAAQIQPVFTESCGFAGCHGASDRFPPGAGLVLDTGLARGNLVGQASQGKPGAVLVVPGDPENSYLIRKLEGAADIAGARMPQGGPYLTPAQLAPFRLWIEQGAPDN